jgi:hypothetical protein
VNRRPVAMNENQTTRPTDAELIILLNETAAWAVRGEHGAPLGQTASLRDALTMAAALERAGQKIIALSLPPDDCIIVFPAQMARLRDATMI